MCKFSYEPSNRFNIFLADSLHDGFDFLLSFTSFAQQFCMLLIRIVLPTTVQTVSATKVED
jgi:hypothetical protein